MFDPLLPQLLTLEDHVFVGSGARVCLHEFRASGFVAGRIIIRRRAIIGAWALLGPGIEIGAGAAVAAGAVVGRDVPPACVALGNPARIVKGKSGPNEPSAEAPASDLRESSDGA
jgi:acetyltransferase-like isoleucine patch superfamily enzyme